MARIEMHHEQARPEVEIPLLLEAHLRACISRRDWPAYKETMRGIQGAWRRLKPELVAAIAEAAANN